MRQLYQQWVDALPGHEFDLVEPAPEWLQRATPAGRRMRVEHPIEGVRFTDSPEQTEQLRRAGWRVCLGPDDFLELVHMQAWYFHARHFPRLRWRVLWAPVGAQFVLSDRPVVWQADGLPDAPPNALRSSEATLVAPLSPTMALFGISQGASIPGGISPRYVNLMSVAGATRWVIGACREAVEEALRLRKTRGSD